MPESPVYKLRYKKKQRRRWEDAAELFNFPDLATWVKDRLDRAAEYDIANPPADR